MFGPTDKVAPELDAVDAVRDGAVARPRRLELQRPHLRLCCASHSRLIPAPKSRIWSHRPVGENDGRTDRSGIGGGRVLDELPLPPRLVRDHICGEGEDLGGVRVDGGGGSGESGRGRERKGGELRVDELGQGFGVGPFLPAGIARNGQLLPLENANGELTSCWRCC